MLVRDILNDAGVLPETKTVIFHAYDEYTTSFPIDYITGNDIIMAYKMNEITTPRNGAILSSSSPRASGAING